MMLRPSPEPRSITKSCGVTFAMSSIFSTVTNGVGTHTTSLPDWPTTGSTLLQHNLLCQLGRASHSWQDAATTYDRHCS